MPEIGKDNDEDKAVENETTALSVNPQNTQPVTVRDKNLLSDFLALAKEEVEVRKQESIIRAKETDNAHEYAMKALGCQADDLKEGRTELRDRRRDYLKVGFIAFLLMLAFLVFCLQTGKEEIAMRIVTYGGTALVSGISGYFIGQKNKPSPPSESND